MSACWVPGIFNRSIDQRSTEMNQHTRYNNVDIDESYSPSDLVIQPDIPICQTDLPLDWYQEEFKPYAAEYLALPDRLPQTVLPWMDRYITPALKYFGDDLILLAHYYMGGEIVKVVQLKPVLSIFRALKK